MAAVLQIRPADVQPCDARLASRLFNFQLDRNLIPYESIPCVLAITTKEACSPLHSLT